MVEAPGGNDDVVTGYPGEVRDPERSWLVTQPDWTDRASIDLFLLQNARLPGAQLWRCDWVGRVRGDDRYYLVIGMEDTPEEVRHPHKLLDGVTIGHVIGAFGGDKVSQGLSGDRIDLSKMLFPGDDDPHGGPYYYDGGRHDTPQPSRCAVELIEVLRKQGFEYVQEPLPGLVANFSQSRFFVAEDGVQGLDGVSSLSLVQS